VGVTYCYMCSREIFIVGGEREWDVIIFFCAGNTVFAKSGIVFGSKKGFLRVVGQFFWRIIEFFSSL